MEVMRFIEIRPGCYCPEAEVHGTYAEIIPVNQLTGLFIDKCTDRNICITFEKNGKSFKRTEYYHDSTECKERWHQLKEMLGIHTYSDVCPLETDIETIDPGYTETLEEYRRTRFKFINATHDYSDEYALTGKSHTSEMRMFINEMNERMELLKEDVT